MFNCSWFDNDGVIEEVKLEFNYQNYSILNNVSGFFSYMLKNLAANEVGYNFRWHAMDNNSAWTSTEWKSFILYKQTIQLTILFNGTESNYFDYFNPIINVSVINLNSSPGFLKFFVDSELRQEIISYSLINISQYLNGEYNITATLSDENYTGYAMKWLNIKEGTPPEIIFEFSTSYLNTTIPEYFHHWLEIKCIIKDSSPITWVYLSENSSGFFTNNSMDNAGNGNWTLSIDISGLNWNDLITFSFFANDTWGNIGLNDNLTALYSLKIHDFQEPSSVLFFIPHDKLLEVNKTTQFTLLADDIYGSGITIIRYKINDSIWFDYEVSFSLNNLNFGYHNISYYSIDAAGNIEEINSIIVILIENPSDSPLNIIPDGSIPSFNPLLLTSIFILISIIYYRRKSHSTK
jgi:hypothetical protein